MQDQEDRRRVFVVHGRNEAARRALFEFLRAVGLQPLEWGHALEASQKGAPFVGEVLDRAFASVRAAVVLLTGDDIAVLAPEFRKPSDPQWETTPTPQARPNVLFEAGLALGRFPDATILVQIGTIRPFSDIAGRHIIALNDSLSMRQELAHRLKIAGCAVDLRGTDWHTAGKFGAVWPVSVAVSLKARPVELKSEEKSILFIFGEDEFLNQSFITARQVAERTSLTFLKTSYHLAELEEKGLVAIVEHDYVSGEPAYSLTRQGRAFLVETYKRDVEESENEGG